MNPWIALVGARDDGRAVAAQAVLATLRGAGVRVGGFLQERITRGDEILGYDLIDLGGGARVPLARPSPRPRICSWGFDEQAFARAASWALRPADVTVIEAGRIEAAGEGHFPALLSTLRASPRVVLVSLRPNVLASIALALPDPADFVELPAEPEEVQALAQRCIDLVATLSQKGEVPRQGALSDAREKTACGVRAEE